MTAFETERIVRSGLFDVEHYERQAGLRFESVAEAVAHYDAFGWRAGLTPSRLFDTRFYLKRNDDIRDAGMNPLAHYVAAGRREGRRPRIGRTPLAGRPAAPPDDRWAELAKVRPPCADDDAGGVDVVVPVFRGRDDTLACIESVLAAANRTPFRLVVIEDASPEPALVATLEHLASMGLFTLLRNPANLGFVETANRGFGLSRERDVVLLNSDTLVYGDWLDRLRAHVLDNARTATVTPMSNNATVLSYPYAPGNNNQLFEISDPELDGIFAAANKGQSAEIPTGVGFCFYVARQALRELGAFDPVFSPGYGEENDFCMRAAKAGWRNLCALDVFVRHTGETSFSDPAGRKAIAAQRLAERHPDYDAQIAGFMAADPLRPAREAADKARAARSTRGRAVLMIDHGWGGGVEKHVRELAALLEDDGVRSFRAFPVGDGSFQIEPLWAMDLPNLPRLNFSKIEATAALLSDLGVGHVHIHSLVGLQSDQFEPLVAGVRAAGLAYDLTWHDYAPICPRLSMVDWGGVYCASPSTDYCQVCVEKAGTRFGPVDAHAWRDVYRRVLFGARRHFAPDADVAERIARYAPELSVVVRPHPSLMTGDVAGNSPSSSREPDFREVAVLGRIGPFKGSSVLLRLAGDALERDLPLRFSLHGTTTRAELADFPNVRIEGEYAEDEIVERLAAGSAALVFFPAVCPETFSFTLDTVLRAGLHPVCFDIGAPARRLRALGAGTVLPLELALDPRALNDRLMSIAAGGRVGAPIEEPGRRWVSAQAYYDGLPPAAAVISRANGANAASRSGRAAGLIRGALGFPRRLRAALDSRNAVESSRERSPPDALRARIDQSDRRNRLIEAQERAAVQALADVRDGSRPPNDGTRPARAPAIVSAPMRVAFVSHSELGSNSAHHVVSVARELQKLGAACVILTPGSDPDSEGLDVPVLGFETALGGHPALRDGVDLVHAWSPREHVRVQTLALCGRFEAPYLVHMEDNEEQLVADSLNWRGVDPDKLTDDELEQVLTVRRSHPRRFRGFIEGAAGYSCLIEALLDFAPSGAPSAVFWPGYDADLELEPGYRDDEQRSALGIGPDEIVLCYPGNTHRSNVQDVRDLYAAVALANRRGGRAVRLIRTGVSHAQLQLSGDDDPGDAVLEQGFVDRAQLKRLLAASDILVQPGGPGPFNDYRFPSKVPEFLASARPTVLAATNIGCALRHGEEALVLPHGSVEEMADAIAVLASDRDLRMMLGTGGLAFARRSLQWKEAARSLFRLYEECRTVKQR